MNTQAVAPLDAYVTADPDEPTFTLQGGDPLAAPLVRLWAFFARRRASTVRIDVTVFEELIEAAIGHSVADDEREQGNLLVRASAAEKVSWQMDAYLKGNRTDAPEEAGDSILDEAARIELHDLRVRVAQKLSNFRCEIIEMRQALVHAGFEDYLGDLLNAENHLVEANRIVEPRRLFKKKD